LTFLSSPGEYEFFSNLLNRVAVDDPTTSPGEGIGISCQYHEKKVRSPKLMGFVGRVGADM
jgi:hypothetical protein